MLRHKNITAIVVALFIIFVISMVVGDYGIMIVSSWGLSFFVIKISITKMREPKNKRL